MKRMITRFTIFFILILAVVGCSTPVETKETPAAAPTATPAPVAPEKETTPISSGITQEDAGIKIRIDKPEFEPFLKLAKPGPIVPGLLQDLIPQGISYYKDKNWLLVSYYREGGKPSVLSVIDETTGKLVKSMELYDENKEIYKGHAGGVTVSQKYVWISSDSNMYYIKLEDLIQAVDQDKLYFSGRFQTDVRASYTTYNEGILWVGEFANGIEYPTDQKHHLRSRDDQEYRAWTEGFMLDEQTDLLPESKIQDGLAVPEYVLAMPNRIQGMTVLADQIILSESFGRNADGSLIFYQNVLSEKPHMQVEFGSKQVPLWFLDGKNVSKTITGPPMTEGIVENDGLLYVLFESGATKFKTSGTYPLDRIYTLPLK